METVWKVPLEITSQQRVLIPRGATLLCVQAQHGKPCLWALVDSDRPLEERGIAVLGTGHKLERGIYVGTFQVLDGDFVGHVFDLGEG